VVQGVLDHAFVGSGFLFGELGKPSGGSSGLGVIFAFQVLPTIIFVAALFGVLYYLGVMQLIVRVLARAMVCVFGASGAESLCVAASIFMGQSEAPLTIRPYLAKLTESELFTVIVAGHGVGVGGDPRGLRAARGGPHRAPADGDGDDGPDLAGDRQADRAGDGGAGDGGAGRRRAGRQLARTCSTRRRTGRSTA
jgi:hypothetical protein